MILSGRRRRLLRFLAAATTAVATILATREVVRRFWLREFDARLRLDAAAVGEQWLRTGAVSCCAPVEAAADEPHGHSGQTYYEIRTGQGQALARSPLLGKAHWPDLPADSSERTAWYHDFHLHRMRYVALRFDSPGQGRRVVFFARDHGELKLLYQELDDALIGLLGLVVLVGAAFLFFRKRSRRRAVLPEPPPSMLSKLLFGSVAISGVILSLGAWATYAVVERGWLVQMDQALESRALGLAALCSKVDGNWRFDGSHLENTIFQDPKSMQYFEARDENGRDIGRSASLGHVSFPTVSLSTGERRFDWFHPGYLHKTRYVAISLPGAHRGLTVFFGQDYRDMKAKLRDLRAILAGIWIASELLLCTLLALLVRLSLAPLRRIAQRLHSIDEEHLEGFDSEGAPREVRPLVAALSATLGRLDEAFKRERTLVADIAHEIRTPMAGIRTTLEVGLGDDEERARTAMATSLSILSRMQSLMDGLLSLARLEGGQIPSSPAATELSPLVQEFAETWREVCSGRGIELRTDLAPALPSFSNPEWCRVILRNLMENALAHATEGSWIGLRSEVASGRVVIQVSNDGSGLDASDAAKVFDRFWRKDHSRRSAGSHAGLGLALCRQLATRMGGGIRAAVPREGEFLVELDLPMVD